MGRNNQRRRADKKRRQTDSPGGSGAAGSAGRAQPGRTSGGWPGAAGPSYPSGSPGGGGGGGGRGGWPGSPLDPPVSVPLLVLDGARAAAAGNLGVLDGALSALDRLGASAGRSTVAREVGTTFLEVLTSVWEDGWQPVEVVREVGRKRSAVLAQVVVASLAAGGSWSRAVGAPMPVAWRRQLDDLGVPDGPCEQEDWILRWAAGTDLTPRAAMAAVFEALGVLLVLPGLEPILVPPTQWATAPASGAAPRPDDPVLAKVRALLAKAESTDFEAEAEALTAKAQQLMSRHAIDESLARAGHASGEQPTTRRLAVDDPYASAKGYLLQVVADANGVRCVSYPTFAMTAVVGFASDLDSVEILFTSLLVQGTRAMLAKGSVADPAGRSRTRSFRQSFLIAFAGRVRERLRDAADDARHVAEEELSTSLLPVLARRDDEVAEAMAATFPRLRHVAGPKATNNAGWWAGRSAADRATLGPERNAVPGMADTA